MRLRLTPVLVALALVALVGCGDDEDGDGSGSPEPAVEAPAVTTSATEDVASPTAAVAECLGAVGYAVDVQGGTAIRANRDDGGPVANIDFFPTQAEADEFAAQLLPSIDYVEGPKSVATITARASSADLAMVESCLYIFG